MANKILIGLLVAAILVIVGFYFFISLPKKEEVAKLESLPAHENYSLRQDKENEIVLLENGRPIQTLTLSEDAVSGTTLLNNKDILVEYYDITFDGYSDLGLLTGVGYGGVNMTYDFYIFNPATKRLEKSEVLSGISNPEFNSEKKTMTSSYRSGPDWFKEVYHFDGTAYTAIDGV